MGCLVSPAGVDSGCIRELRFVVSFKQLLRIRLGDSDSLEDSDSLRIRLRIRLEDSDSLRIRIRLRIRGFDEDSGIRNLLEVLLRIRIRIR